MGMYDQYEPVPQIECPVCRVPLVEWQGKEGPCAIFIWRQGVAGPVDQPIDEECRLPEAERSLWRLPKEFCIYSYDCGLHRVSAECAAAEGVWTTTRVTDCRTRPVAGSVGGRPGRRGVS